MSKTKSFCISKQNFVLAWKRVKQNGGAAGVDGVMIKDYEKNLKANLYKLWNRMSSGTYFPKPVRRVYIPKADGKMRPLGIPTVEDRIAQMVTRMSLESTVEPIFHVDSYGYRPNKSATDAIGVARKRCWQRDWVIDLDIKGFFDNLDHELLMKAVKIHSKEKWVTLYIERWLKAPVEEKESGIINTENGKGTPQGGVISPLLANLFMHYAFDRWISEKFPSIQFERYADDIILHCFSETQAEMILEAVRNRLKECKLELHPIKTKIVYCKDVERIGTFENVQFDFLGYSFQPRLSRDKNGRTFVNFSPAISAKAANQIRSEIREWKLSKRTSETLNDLAKMINPKTIGWINYYGKYYRSALYPVLYQVERAIIKWVMRKYKNKKRHQRKSAYWLGKVAVQMPNLFAHWKFGARSFAG